MTSRASLSRRLIGLAGVAALTVGGAGAVLLGAGTAYAAITITPTLVSNNFTIGTSSVGGVTFAASSSTTSATAVVYTFGFTLPAGVSGATGVTPGGLPGATTTGASVVLVNNTTGTNYGIATKTTGTTGAFTIPAVDVVAGDTYTAQVFGFANSPTAGTYSPTVTVTGFLPGSAATFTLNAATVAPTPSLALSNTTAGLGGVTYTFSNWAQGTAAGTTLYLELSSTNAVFPSAVGQYTVTDTPSGSSTSHAIAVTGASPGLISTTGQYEVLTLASTTVAGDTLNVTVTGVQNPSASGFSNVAILATAPTTAPATPSGAFSIGNSLASASLSVSPTTVSAKNAVYAVSFTLPSTYTPAVTTISTISSVFTDSLGNAPGAATSWAIFDSTTPAATVSGTALPATIPLAAQAGDSLTVDYYGITNTAAASVSGAISLSSGFTVPVTTNTVAYTAASTASVYPTVTVSNPVAGGTATYTITGLVAGSAGIPAGSALQVQFGTNTAPQGTLSTGTYPALPTSPANYTLTDLSSSSGSGLSNVPLVSAGGANLTNTNAINAGDNLQLTITGVINPGTGNNYAAEFAGFSGSSQLVGVPSAAVTYSNGALVQSGSQIDVIAGGYAFGIPSFSTYQTIAGMLGTTVVSGSFPTATAPRAGTLIQPVGSAGVWVVGTNGMIYQFSSASQLTSDGYSFMNVIPVPSAAGLTAGTGVPPTAAVTTPDGALVQYGTTIYVYAGGTPFGIPTFANYQTIAAATGTMVVQGSGTTPVASSTTANGVLVQPLGTAGIWVTYNGSLYPFSTPAQLTSDGYSFNYVVPVPTTGSLNIA